eukprot:m.204578 g.204578  ORF g.204578 m.204578 type:complete len:144 (+) comp18871_c0_seq42:3485-3916(+)
MLCPSVGLKTTPKHHVSGTVMRAGQIEAHVEGVWTGDVAVRFSHEQIPVVIKPSTTTSGSKMHSCTTDGTFEVANLALAHDKQDWGRAAALLTEYDKAAGRAKALSVVQAPQGKFLSLDGDSSIVLRATSVTNVNGKQPIEQE